MLRLALLTLVILATAACGSLSARNERELARLEQALRDQQFNRLIVTVNDTRRNLSSTHIKTYRPGSMLITADDMRRHYFADDKTPGEELGLKLVDSYYVQQLGIYTLVYESDDRHTLADAALKLQHDKRIDSVIPVNTYHTRSSHTDPLGAVLPGIQTDTLTALHELATGDGIDIAIIDTGVDILHEDIAYEQFTLFDMVGDNHPAETHGTAVAGLIAAVPDNGVGIRGIAPDASIIMLRACRQEQETNGAVCTTDTIAKSLSLALRAGVDIVNLSLTGPMDSLLEQLVTALIDQGTLVIAAHADTADLGPFPGEIPGVIAATALPEQQVARKHTVFIPGGNIMTLLPGNRYGPRNGVSISTAQLSGLAALFLQRHPGMTAGLLYSTLRDAHLESGDDTHLIQALMSAAPDIQSFAGEPVLQE